MARRLSEGFTIPELLIATSVFSVVLATTMAIFFIIGHLFFKGVSITQTEQAAKRIQDTVASDIGAAPTDFDSSTSTSTRFPYLKYICIGDARYSFFFNHKVDIGTENINTGNFGLVRDAPPTGCKDPLITPIDSNADELLGNKNRLSDFGVTGNDNIRDIDITLAYGDDEVLNGLPSIQGVSSSPTCKPGLSTSQFCSVTTLSTAVSQGF